MNFKKALLAATVLALPLAAQAQPITGVYVGAGAGFNQSMNADVTSDRNFAAGVTGAQRKASIEFDAGFGGVLSVGYGFGNGLRAEIEGNYRQGDVDQIKAGIGGRLPGISGTVRTYGAMANVLFDLPLALPVPVTPYIGGGVGYAWTDYDNVGSRFYTPAGGNGRSFNIDDKDGNFAFQGIAGVAFPITAVPGLAVTAEYRFFGTLDPKVTGSSRELNGPAIRQKFETENYNHSAFVGLRYAFNAPRPVAPAPVVEVAPAAAPAPARTYLVFFDFDRADLTDRARQIIAEAAQNANRVQATRIEVAGHADRSGSPQYNQRLSQRRADAVAAELTRQGIQRSAITVQAFGESRPLVATADGVREPQNRRVEIVLR
ncbi:OmpA family protein [Pseudoroseomonas wenyumeiae]|uniref:OmpA family protein n=1 Tax=Teichococcus wenyumeiae TaxID=2478470 RepID=A0A3A9JVD0_9PROT|nr:OmpA family protein [Pseudoroseomonas wenyumeiae]RKK02969.1 OmpA family protein [Pseudoroseomonas wenyumeiae]RMI26502.1 OmpA family protein [Pseudoroseomonas wenyumeiae]